MAQTKMKICSLYTGLDGVEWLLGVFFKSMGKESNFKCSTKISSLNSEILQEQPLLKKIKKCVNYKRRFGAYQQ